MSFVVSTCIASKYGGNRSMADDGLTPSGSGGCSLLASSSLLGTPARSNPIQRPRKNPQEEKKKREKTQREREREPKPETNTKTKQGAKQTRDESEPIPTHEAAAAGSRLATRPSNAAERAARPRALPPARPPVSSDGNSSSAGPRPAPAPARQPQLLPVPEVSSIPAVSRIRFGSAGRAVSLAGDPAGTSSPELREAGDHASIALGFGRVIQLARLARGLYARFGPAAPLPGRLLDLAAVGAAPAEMRSPPWPASWELGYGLTLCRKRRKP